MRGYRVQARRKGVRGYVNIMRPTRWQNPHPIAPDSCPECGGVMHTRAEALRLFTEYAEQRLAAEPDWLEPLRDRDLGCTCPPDEQCHADILLDLLARITPTTDHGNAAR